MLGEQDVHTVFVGKVHAYRPVEELGFSETIETNDGSWGFYEAQRRRPLARMPGGRGAPRQIRSRVTRPGATDVTYMDAAIDWLQTRAPDSGSSVGPLRQPGEAALSPFLHRASYGDKYRDHGDLPAHGTESRDRATPLRRGPAPAHRGGARPGAPGSRATPGLLRLRQLYRRATRAAVVRPRGGGSRGHDQRRLYLGPRRDAGQVRAVVEVQPARGRCPYPVHRGGVRTSGRACGWRHPSTCTTCRPACSR